MIYSFFIRFFVVLGIISSLIIENVEYKSALIILSIIYLLFFSILSITSEKKKNMKFVFYGIDTIFLTFIIYITGLTYLSTFVIPFFSEFLEGKEEHIFFSIFSVIPVGIALYLSNFSDYIFLPLIIAGLTAIFKVKKEFNEKEWYFKKLKTQMENLYMENLSLQEKIHENQAHMEVIPTLQALLKEELNLKETLYQLNEIFRTKGMAFIDFMNHKCISIGDGECKKEALAYIKDEIQIIDAKEILEMFKAKKIYSVVINDKESIVFGILLLIFEEDKTVEPRLLRIIKDYLDFYFASKAEKKEDKEEKKD